MPVEVEVSDEQLEKPGVGKALADLMLALAGEVPVRRSEPVVKHEQPVVQPEPEPLKEPKAIAVPPPTTVDTPVVEELAPKEETSAP